MLEGSDLELPESIFKEYSRTATYGAILALSCLGGVIRLQYLGRAMRSDEADTYLSFASGTLWNALSNYSIPNNHILSSVLVLLSTGIFGDEPWAIRLPAFIAGIALVPLTFLAVRKCVGDAAALSACALVSISPTMIDFSVNARGYTLAASFFLAQLAISNNLSRDSSLLDWAIFCILGAAGLWTVPTYVFCLAPIFLLLLWREYQSGPIANFNPRIWQSMIVSGILTLLCYLPVLIGSGMQALSENSFVKARSTPHILLRLLIVPNDYGILFGWGFPYIIKASLAVFGLVAVLFAARTKLRLMPFIVSCGVCAVILIFLKHRIPPQRTWLMLLPLGYAVVSLGVVCFATFCWRKPFSSRAAILLVLISISPALSVNYKQLIHFSNRTGRALGSSRVADELVAHQSEAPLYVFSLLSYGAPLKYYLSRNGGIRHFKIITHHDRLPEDLDLADVKQVLVLGKAAYTPGQFRDHYSRLPLPKSEMCMRKLSKRGDITVYLLTFSKCPDEEHKLSASGGARYESDGIKQDRANS